MTYTQTAPVCAHVHTCMHTGTLLHSFQTQASASLPGYELGEDNRHSYCLMEAVSVRHLHQCAFKDPCFPQEALAKASVPSDHSFLRREE